MVVPVLTVFEKRTNEHSNFHDFQTVKFVPRKFAGAFARNVRRSTKYPRYESYRDIYEAKETLLGRDRLQKSTPLRKSPLLSFNLVRFVSCACPSNDKFKPYRPRNGTRTIFLSFPPILLQLVATTRHNCQRRIRVCLAHGKLLSVVRALK